MRLAWLVIVACAAVGCSGTNTDRPPDAPPSDAPPPDGPPPDGPPPDARLEPDPDDPLNWVTFQPPDLETSAGTEVSVMAPWDSPETVERAVSLWTWPERELVPMRLDRPVEGMTSHRTTYVLPETPLLLDRWYAVGGTFDPEVIVGPGPHDVGGTRLNRFRVGPMLIMRSVLLTRLEEATEIVAGFSERVRSVEVAPVRVTVEGSALACSLMNAEELALEEGSGAIRLRCPPIEPGAVVTVAPATELHGLASGLPLTAPDGSAPGPIDIVAPEEIGETVGARPVF
jgi:hypothetical protein